MGIPGYLALAALAGVGLAFQAIINARLSAALGSPIWATVVQVFVGLVLLFFVVAVTRQPIPSFASASRLPWWIWTGGMLGAAYVLIVILSTRSLGVALMVASVIVGQTLAASVQSPVLFRIATDPQVVHVRSPEGDLLE